MCCGQNLILVLTKMPKRHLEKCIVCNTKYEIIVNYAFVVCEYNKNARSTDNKNRRLIIYHNNM